MLEQLLKELADLYNHLKKTGYFDRQTKTERKRMGRQPGPQGPRTKPQIRGRKLTQQEVLEIYHDKTSSYEELCEYYDVHWNTIYSIKTGKTWSLLTGHKK